MELLVNRLSKQNGNTIYSLETIIDKYNQYTMIFRITRNRLYDVLVCEYIIYMYI